MLRFVARLTIDERLGVWLEREDDRARFVIAEQPDGVWRPFADLQVVVEGELEAPDRARLRVLSLRPADRKAYVDPAVVGPEVTLRGRFERRAGEPGTKSEGSSWLVFTPDAGGAYLLEGERPAEELVGPPVQVRARIVEPSPFKTRLGGDYLWLLRSETIPG